MTVSFKGSFPDHCEEVLFVYSLRKEADANGANVQLQMTLFEFGANGELYQTKARWLTESFTSRLIERGRVPH